MTRTKQNRLPDLTRFQLLEIEEDREGDFDRSTGRFRGDDGEFDVGSPPPDFDDETDRYRGENGQFKKRSDDLFDEEDEVLFDDLGFDG